VKKKLKDIKEKVILFLLETFLILFPFICVAVVILFAYMVSTSNLPDWFKFWILSSR
jgi:hypothetical protein